MKQTNPSLHVYSIELLLYNSHSENACVYWNAFFSYVSML